MQPDEPAPTRFLPAERTPPSLLAAEIARAAASPLVAAVLEASGAAAAVLDAHRQVVAFNTSYLVAAGVEEPAQVLGLRPGETLGCTYVEHVSTGCGTTAACPSCGAALAIVAAMQGTNPAERRCALATWRDGVRVEREFQARATPLRIEDAPFVLLTLHDVSAESRRALLERCFLHDLSNLVSGLEAASEVLASGGDEISEEVQALAQQLGHEVRLQKLLAGDDGRALDGAARRPFEVSQAIALLRRTIRHHPAHAGRTVEWPQAATGVLIPAQPGLLHHVLMNMLLNALEASPPGAQIRVEVAAEADQVGIRVWNPSAIPPAVAPRIFQRYFSTKAEPGHGHGTWSMKVFGEELLGGKVTFETSPAEGTSFQIAFPRLAQ